MGSRNVLKFIVFQRKLEFELQLVVISAAINRVKYVFFSGDSYQVIFALVHFAFICIHSSMAQWQRAGLITPRSLDRNELLLINGYKSQFFPNRNFGSWSKYGATYVHTYCIRRFFLCVIERQVWNFQVITDALNFSALLKSQDLSLASCSSTVLSMGFDASRRFW